MTNKYLTTREFLEQAMQKAREAGAFSDEEPFEETKEEQDGASQEECADAVQVKTAPKKPRCLSQKFADKFCELPADWQDYLCQFEQDVFNSASDLSVHHMPAEWLNDLFLMRDKSLSGDCADARQWVEKMAFVEHMLCAHPSQMLRALARLYLAPAMHSCCTNTAMVDYYKNRRRVDAQSWLEKRLSEKDNQGNLCFPHYKSVMDLILRLLSAELAPDVSKAYTMAVWIDENTRKELLAEAVQNAIRQKAEEAREAKEKAFMKNTNQTAIIQNDRPKTTREFLEEAFKKHNIAF